MTGKAEIEGRRPRLAPRLEEVAFLLLQRTADHLLQSLALALKPHGLSPAQYNVLRILRGAGAEGLPCGEIGSRMITRDPDITRLLDRLEKRDLVERCREQKDRRVVTVRITRDGLALLKELEPVIRDFQAAQLGQFGEKKLRSLISLLGQVRDQKS
jgi:DNA-binding MarR family transcriptional regulator